MTDSYEENQAKFNIPSFPEETRNPDGSANWKEDYEKISRAFVYARSDMYWAFMRDRNLIEYLLKLRLEAKLDKNFKLADDIRDLLIKCKVTVEDKSDHTWWQINGTLVVGEVK